MLQGEYKCNYTYTDLDSETSNNPFLAAAKYMSVHVNLLSRIPPVKRKMPLK